MNTRAMRADDLGRVAELSGQLGYPASEAQLGPRFERIAKSADDRLFVVELEGRVVGWTHVAVRHLIESPPFAEIEGLVVDALARGRGVGSALVAAAVQATGAFGLSVLRVRSNVARVEAHPFYQALGFTRVKTSHMYERAL